MDIIEVDGVGSDIYYEDNQVSFHIKGSKSNQILSLLKDNNDINITIKWNREYFPQKDVVYWYFEGLNFISVITMFDDCSILVSYKKFIDVTKNHIRNNKIKSLLL